MIRFVPLATRPADWDARIRDYPGKTLFHESGWLDHVETIHPRSRIVYFEIRDDDEIVGLHCGLKVWKGMLPIHGSPLGGTGTNFMGPMMRDGVDQRAVIRALAGLASVRQFLHLELSSVRLDPDAMRAEGFSMQTGVTHLIRLGGSIEDAWNGMKSEARNRVRKAEKNGLIVEATRDPAIVDHFFAQFTEVYAKQGMVTPFGIERARSLFETLLPAGRLLALSVRKDDQVVASGLFPFDENCIYFWGAASWLKDQKLCPNEALHWAVLEFAARNGIRAYNMCGGTSQFKDKFGGEDVPYLTYYRSSLPLMGLARNLYRARHFRALRRAAAS